ncbi:hypothetical protein [Pseudoalteromonas sp. T1lg76]|uniref:hypothetical protein n=1 Tax=Pseudoalteromonas sp. T1lg76 TaxID=2077103 RepID=UPI000CF71DAA|nr:hypothetical protein [Pseudoalteromonas sp. T1lg76]
MKKIVFIDTTWPINSRTARFKSTLARKFDVIVSAWNRGEYTKEIPEDARVLQNNLKYGNQLKKLLSLPKFIKHCYKVIKTEKAEVIFASHWDSLLCAVLIKKFLNKKIDVIYDCLDLPTSNNQLVLNGLRVLERYLLRSTQVTVLASRYFKGLYSEKLTTYVFENYPSKVTFENGLKQNQSYFHAPISIDGVSVAWIGVVRYFNILENILEAIQGTDIHFLVYGDGPELENLKKRVSDLEMDKQVSFFGKYQLADLPNIYESVDFVWAAYPTKDFNALYAISNKYFECSYFSKVPIFSKETMMAKDLKNRSNNVILIDEYNVSDIRKELLSKSNLLKESYSKYEPDIFWEDREDDFLRFITSTIKNNI